MARYIDERNTQVTPQGFNAETEKIANTQQDHLSRKAVDGPNQMETTLDMNSERIINLPDPQSDSEPLTFGSGKQILDESTAQANRAEQEADRAAEAAQSAEQDAQILRENLDGKQEEIDQAAASSIQQMGIKVGEVDTTASSAIIAINNTRDNVEDEFQEAISSLTVTSPFDFTEGGTVTARNQAILWPVSDGGDGTQYRWDGELPKEVPPSSTPDSTGGVGVGSWVDVGQAALRSDLSDESDLALGSSLIRRNVVALSSLKDLGNPRLPRREDLRYDNMGFYSDSTIGGGSWKWKPNEPKANHNGGTIVDPDRAAAWSGLPADLETLFHAIEDGGATGCFELTSRADIFTFGASDTHDSAKSVEQASKFLSEVRNDGRVLIQSEALIHSCWLTGVGEYLIDVDGPGLVAVEDGVYLHGLTINGMGIPRTTGTADGFTSIGNDNIGVDQCHFIGFKCADIPELAKLSAVHITQAENIRITNNRVDGGGFRGLHVRLFKDAVITGNIVSDCENTGIQVYGERDGPLVSDRCVIANNIVSNIRSKNTGLDGAIHCYTSVRKLTVTGNVVENFDGRGIDMDTTSQCIIANNVITVSPVSWDNPRYPISGAIRINRRTGWDYISPDGAIITGNSVFIKDGSNITDVIRVLGDSTGPIISNNNLSTEEGVALADSARYIRVTSSSGPLISGNRIVHRASNSPSNVRAILIDTVGIGPADGAQINNNTIVSTDEPIYIILDSIQGALEMIGNTIEKCSLNTRQSELGRCIVKSNTFVDHEYASFRSINPEGFFEISGNTFARASGSGVECSGNASSAIITRNVFCANDTEGPNNYQLRARLPCTISHNTFIQDGMSASNTTGDIRVLDGCIIHSNDFTRSLGTIRQDGTGNQVLTNITLPAE